MLGNRQKGTRLAGLALVVCSLATLLPLDALKPVRAQQAGPPKKSESTPPQKSESQETNPPANATTAETSEATPSAESEKPSTVAGENGATAAGSDAEGTEEEEYIPPPPPPPRDRTPIELRPYRVEIPVVFAPSPGLGPAIRKRILEDLKTRVDRCVAPMWDATIYEPVWLTPRSQAGIERIRQRTLVARNRVVSTIEVLAKRIAEESEGAVRFELTYPIPPDLEASIRTLIALDTDVDLDEERTRQVLALIDRLGGGELKQETKDLIAELMVLYLLPTPMKIDKFFPIAIEKRGSHYVVSGREWDRNSEKMTPVESRSTLDRRGVANLAMSLLADLFHPIAQIDAANPPDAQLRLRAGQYRPADPAFTQAKEGELFIPFFRYLDEDRVIKRLQYLPWSYLTANSIERSRLASTLTTGVATPLGAFRRRRMELRAIALRPSHPETTLTLVPRRNMTKPLVGYLVAVYEELPPPAPKKGEEPPEDQKIPDKIVLRSNRLGQVTVPVNPEYPLQWVIIRSGSAMLTKFPFVPGAEPHMLVDCPDDTIRLDVEGQVVLLQSRLIDTIAKRAVVMSMIRNRAKKTEWEKVDESLKELNELPTIEEFRKGVSEIQYPAIQKAKARKDRISERRIKRLGRDVLKVAGIHLDEEKLEEFREQIRELKELDKTVGGETRRAAPSAN